jgi:hypothetical protein
MDPALIAVIGLITTGIGIRFLEVIIGRDITFGRGKNPKAIATKTYEQRWSDLDYVGMIHTTRNLEEVELGYILTDCLCAEHTKPAPQPVKSTSMRNAIEAKPQDRIETEYDYVTNTYMVLRYSRGTISRLNLTPEALEDYKKSLVAKQYAANEEKKVTRIKNDRVAYDPKTGRYTPYRYADLNEAPKIATTKGYK